MNIIISNSSDKPIYEQITNQVKALVMGGQLKEGDSLPSMRTLAKELRISVITTKRAYEDLEERKLCQGGRYQAGAGRKIKADRRTACQGSFYCTAERNWPGGDRRNDRAYLPGRIGRSGLSFCEQTPRQAAD